MKLIVTANRVKVATVMATCSVMNRGVLVTRRIAALGEWVDGSSGSSVQRALRKNACSGTVTTARIPAMTR